MLRIVLLAILAMMLAAIHLAGVSARATQSTQPDAKPQPAGMSADAASALALDGAFVLPLRPRTLPLLTEHACVPDLAPWLTTRAHLFQLDIESGADDRTDRFYRLEGHSWTNGDGYRAVTAGELAKLLALAELPCEPAPTLPPDARWFQLTVGGDRGARVAADSPLGRAIAAVVADVHIDPSSDESLTHRFGEIGIHVMTVHRGRRYYLEASDGSVTVYSDGSVISTAITERQLLDAAACISEQRPSRPSRRPGWMTSSRDGVAFFELVRPVDARLAFLVEALEHAIEWREHDPY